MHITFIFQSVNTLFCFRFSLSYTYQHNLLLYSKIKNLRYIIRKEKGGKKENNTNKPTNNCLPQRTNRLNPTKEPLFISPSQVSCLLSFHLNYEAIYSFY